MSPPIKKALGWLRAFKSPYFNSCRLNSNTLLKKQYSKKKIWKTNFDQFGFRFCQTASLSRSSLNFLHHWLGNIRQNLSTIFLKLFALIYAHSPRKLTGLQVFGLKRKNVCGKQLVNFKVISSIRTPMLIQGRLDRTETNLMHCKWEVIWTHGHQPNTF